MQYQKKNDVENLKKLFYIFEASKNQLSRLSYLTEFHIFRNYKF